MTAAADGRAGAVRIQSDGTSRGTRIEVCGVDGAWIPLKGVERVGLTLDASDPAFVRVRLHLVRAALEVVAPGERVELARSA